MQVKEREGVHRKCYHAKNNGMDVLSAEIQSLKSQLALTQATLGELIVNGVEDLKEKNSYIEILQIIMKDLEAKVEEQREEIEEIEEIEEQREEIEEQREEIEEIEEIEISDLP
jgi:DNA repair exonuclease SbcCD ATPase subunit